jgi:small GTP-binding protein
MESKGSQFRFKVSVIGDYAVGKTSIIKRYMTDSFDEGYKATLGAAISTFKSKAKDSDISLQVWDLAGQTSFRRVRVQYLFGTDFAIVVYDVTRKDSLKTHSNALTNGLMMSAKALQKFSCTWSVTKWI